MSFKLSIDEDLLLIRTKPGFLNLLLFFKSWSYKIELPISRISKVEFERRAGISTLLIYKKPKPDEFVEKQIPVSLHRANQNQIDFLKEALPFIVAEQPIYKEIKLLLQKHHLC